LTNLTPPAISQKRLLTNRRDNMADSNKAWAKIIAKAWSDEAFKEKLLSDPASVCQEYGIEVPAGVTLEVHENTKNRAHVILPATPKGELSDKQLEQLAAGALSGISAMIG
jgi:Nitrile hydratase, alpha chain